MRVYGCARVCARAHEGRDDALFADEATYRKAIDDCAAEGITLEMTHIAIPGARSLHRPQPLSTRSFSYSTDTPACSESITLGLPGRDKDIQQVCRCIEAAGKAGLRGLNYNFLVTKGCQLARTRAAASRRSERVSDGVLLENVCCRLEQPTCATSLHSLSSRPLTMPVGPLPLCHFCLLERRVTGLCAAGTHR